MKLKCSLSIFIFFVALLCFLPLAYTIKQIVSFDVSPRHSSRPNLDALLSIRNNSFSVLAYIKLHIPSDKVILAFDQSLFAKYTNNKFVSFMDPLLLRIYQADTKARAYQLLKDKDISYIYIPDFADPVFFNSKLAELIADPAFVWPLFQSGSSRLYQLRDDSTSYEMHDLVLPKEWQILSKEKKSLGGLYQGKDDMLLSNRDISPTAIKYLVSGFGDFRYFDQYVSIPKDYKTKSFLLQSQLAGTGYYQINVLEYDKKDRLIGVSQIWQDVLREKGREIASLFLLKRDTDKFRIYYQLNKIGKMTINEVKLFVVEDKSQQDKKRLATGQLENWSVYKMRLGMMGFIDWYKKKLFGLHNLEQLTPDFVAKGIKFEPLNPTSQYLISKPHAYNRNYDYFYEFKLKGQGILKIYLLYENFRGEQELALISSKFLSKQPKNFNFKLMPDIVPYEISRYPVNQFKMALSLDSFSDKAFVQLTDFKLVKQKGKNGE